MFQTSYARQMIWSDNDQLEYVFKCVCVWNRPYADIQSVSQSFVSSLTGLASFYIFDLCSTWLFISDVMRKPEITMKWWEDQILQTWSLNLVQENELIFNSLYTWRMQSLSVQWQVQLRIQVNDHLEYKQLFKTVKLYDEILNAS